MDGTYSVTPVKIVKVTVTDDSLAVDLEGGRSIAVRIGWFPRLAYGTPAERANFQISGAGHGIHWPDLDEDISVVGLLQGQQSRESHASLAKWLQSRGGKNLSRRKTLRTPGNRRGQKGLSPSRRLKP